MPALQVRDFPEDLYERLKEYAASQHRSIAQQTVVAVRIMLEAADELERFDDALDFRYHPVTYRPEECLYAPRRQTEEEIAARAEKRKKLFDEIDRIPKKRLSDEELHDLLEEARKERDARGGFPFDDEDNIELFDSKEGE